MQTLTQKKKYTYMNFGLLVLLFVFVFLADRFLPSYDVKAKVLQKGAVFALIAVSMNLLNGFTGLFSLGQAGFMLVGAYTFAVLNISSGIRSTVYQYYDPLLKFSLTETLQNVLGNTAGTVLGVFVSLLLAGFLAAVLAYLIGLPVLKLKSDYLAIATLGFAEIIRVLIVNLTPITNGSLGIKGIPFHASLLVNYGWLLITLYCMVKLLGSNFGNIFKAIRDDEIAAKVMGIDTFRTKVLSFCLGAFFAGVGGALLGNLLTTIDPKMFTFLLTFNVLMIVVAGGLGSLTGSILGSAVITVLLEWLRAVEEPITLGGFAIPGIPGMRMVVFSLVLLCIILYRREGIMGMREITWDAIFDFFSRRKRA